MDKISNQNPSNNEHSTLYQATTLVILFFAFLIILAAIYKACESWYPRLLDIIQFQPYLKRKSPLQDTCCHFQPDLFRDVRGTGQQQPRHPVNSRQWRHFWGAALGGSCSHRKTLGCAAAAIGSATIGVPCSLHITPTKCLIYYKNDSLKCESRWNRTSNNHRSWRQSM